MATAPTLGEIFTTTTPNLRRYIASRFPRLCPGRVEDAVADTFLIAATDPELLTRAWEGGGMAQVQGLLHTIAWRCARAGVCRGAGAWEICSELMAERSGQVMPCQEMMTELHLHLISAVEDAAREVCARRASEITVALWDRLNSGDADSVVAARHGIAREYLNEARRKARQTLFEER